MTTGTTQTWLVRLGWMLFALALASPGWAQEPPLVGELTALDRQFMQTQRERLESLARRHLGTGFSGETDRDLDLLQRLLDRDLVQADQKRELQAMGVILGDLLARELGMHWVLYEDEVGRSRALRYRDSDLYLFPMTMISRRREAGDQTPVAVIYASAVDEIRSELPPLPFQ